MPFFETNDRVRLRYDVAGPEDGNPIILIHGFTGSAKVWRRNIPSLSHKYRCITYDLRGHGDSDKPTYGHHVSRLAMDLHELIKHLKLDQREDQDLMAIGGSLGCSILWCYIELFSSDIFSRLIFVDQSPLQNSTLDGWNSEYCNRGMNNAAAVAALQTTLALRPEAAHQGTIAACLGYRYESRRGDAVTPDSIEARNDEEFFLGEAMKGDQEWFGKLMADHTALDWRQSIPFTLGGKGGSCTLVLVIASDRSGCFPAAGPLSVVDLINDNDHQYPARGVTVDFGGHWCYWEDPEKFNAIVHDFFEP